MSSHFQNKLNENESIISADNLVSLQEETLLLFNHLRFWRIMIHTMIFHLLVYLLAICLSQCQVYPTGGLVFIHLGLRKKTLPDKRLYIYASIQCCSVHEVEKFWTEVFNISEERGSTWYEGKNQFLRLSQYLLLLVGRERSLVWQSYVKDFVHHQNLFLRLIKQQGFRKKGISFCVLGKMHIDS